MFRGTKKLHEAACKEDTSSVKAFLDKGFNVNARDQYDATPLTGRTTKTLFVC
jgi:ankyrin repeat protein